MLAEHPAPPLSSPADGPPGATLASRHGGWLAIGAWLLVLCIGFGLAIDFEAKPGQSADATAWPADTRLSLAASGKTLVMFLHPECPCSAASLDELEKLLAHASAPTKTFVVFVHARPTDPQTDNLARASQIPGAAIEVDTEGEEARRFGSRTSGDLFIFDAAGQLEFEGGITPSRGHVGPGTCSDAAAAAIASLSDHPARVPVYGCPLFSAPE